VILQAATTAVQVLKGLFPLLLFFVISPLSFS